MGRVWKSYRGRLKTSATQKGGIGLGDRRVNRSFPGGIGKKGVLGERAAYAKAWKKEGGH